MDVRIATAHRSGRIRGGVSRPSVVECDDHREYVVKFPLPEWPRALINEAVGGTLADLLGLPVPDLCLIEVPAHVAASIESERGTPTPAGTYFGIRFVPNIMPVNSYMADVVQPNQIENRDALSSTMVFDYWMRNADRHDRNVALELLTMNQDADFRMWIIDNGLVFGSAEWTIKFLVDTAGIAPAIQTPSVLSQASLDIQAAVDMEAAILALDVESLRPVFAEIPGAWGLEPGAGSAIEDFLNHRKPIVHAAIQSLTPGAAPAPAVPEVNEDA